MTKIVQKAKVKTLDELAVGDLFALLEDETKVGCAVYVRGTIKGTGSIECIRIFAEEAVYPNYRVDFLPSISVALVVIEGNFIVEV